MLVLFYKNEAFLMNIQSTQSRMVALRPNSQQQQPPSQPPAQQDPTPPADNFDVNFSGALETVVPIYTAYAVAGWGATGGAIGGAIVGGIVGGGVGAFVGGLAGFAGGGYLGIKGGRDLGQWAMQKSGDVGAAHNPENPAQGKAIGQAIAGGAITFFTGSPLMTAVVVGGSAAYAAHKTAAQG
jgi:hypothetical protein